MRQDMHHLTAVRMLDVCGQRVLLSRGKPRDLESMPTRQSMRQAVPHFTYPRTLKLSPAKRWLQQQVNRPWNAVYSELCQRFDRRNLQQAEVLDRLLRQVDLNVYLDEDGKAMVAGTWGQFPVRGLYVHPKTKLLLDAKTEGSAKLRDRTWREKKAAELAAKRVDVSDTLQLHCVDGIWYWVELAPIHAPQVTHVPAYRSSLTGEVIVPAYTRVHPDSVCRDMLSGREYRTMPAAYYETRGLVEAYGRPDHYAKRKWQASTRDLKRYVNGH